MYGAIIGDMVGSPLEHVKEQAKSKEFPLFCAASRLTDDSVMTVAVADALTEGQRQDMLGEEEEMKDLFIYSMHLWGNRYLNAGYGRRFYRWLLERDSEPYNSYGNGSAMRVSPAAWVADSLEQTLQLARWSAEVTHDHPEGIKGAQAIAASVWMARQGCSKEEIRTYVSETFGYDMDRTCDQIRPGYTFDVSCQGSVPEAIIAFLEGTDFEDVIRTAVSLGGDTDTIAAMAGSIAEPFYGVPMELRQECEARLPEDMKEIVDGFRRRYLAPAR